MKGIKFQVEDGDVIEVADRAAAEAHMDALRPRDFFASPFHGRTCVVRGKLRMEGQTIVLTRTIHPVCVAENWPVTPPPEVLAPSENACEPPGVSREADGGRSWTEYRREPQGGRVVKVYGFDRYQDANGALLGRGYRTTLVDPTFGDPAL